MGWLDSPQAVHKGKLDAFFENRNIDLDLIVRLSIDYKNSKNALEKAVNMNIHNSKRNIKHQLCAQDFNYKSDLLYYSIDKFYQQNNPLYIEFLSSSPLVEILNKTIILKQETIDILEDHIRLMKIKTN